MGAFRRPGADTGLSEAQLGQGCSDALIKTLEITALIMFLVAASNFFGAVFSRLGTPMMLTEFSAWP